MAVPIKKLIAALRKHDGNMTLAGEEVGITRQAVWLRCNTSKSASQLQAVLKDIDETLNDAAESETIRAIREGDTATARWRLVQKAKDRGYGKAAMDDDQLAQIVGAMSAEDLKKMAEGS